MAAHGFPRATGDLDLWVKADENNSRKLFRALAKFGAPLDQIKQNEFISEG
jgi:hypothetical protein